MSYFCNYHNSSRFITWLAFHILCLLNFEEKRRWIWISLRYLWVLEGRIGVDVMTSGRKHSVVSSLFCYRMKPGREERTVTSDYNESLSSQSLYVRQQDRYNIWWWALSAFWRIFNLFVCISLRAWWILLGIIIVLGLGEQLLFRCYRTTTAVGWKGTSLYVCCSKQTVEQTANDGFV